MADHDLDRYRDPRPRDIRSPLRFYLWLIAGQKWRVARAGFYGSTWMVGLTIPPLLLSKAIDEGLTPKHLGVLAEWVAALTAVIVGNAVLGGLRHNTMTKIRTYSGLQISRATIRHSTRLGAALTRKSSSGEVVAIGLGDVQTIALALTFTGPGVGSVVAYALVAVILFSISWVLALVVLTGVPVLALVVGPLLHRTQKAMTPYREQTRTVIHRLIDVVGGLRVLNGLGGKDAHQRRFREDSQEAVRLGYRVGSADSWTGALGGGLPTVFLAAVTWIAARMAASGSITLGQLIGVYGYVAMLVLPVAFLIEGAQQITAGTVAARRVIGFLALQADQSDGTRGALPDPAVLLDPASGVEIAPGRFVALASAAPADCAAVLERLSRFTETDATWGGIPLADIPAPHIRARILLADNDDALFAGTVRDVVSGAHAEQDSSLDAAIRAAAARDVVDGLPDGLDSLLESQARNLSGGQRQRLRMARALYARPEVLLLAEPTSAVDAHTEALMARGLRDVRRGLTTVVSTSSPLVLDQADVVLHLVDGRVAAAGSHRELWESDPGYRAVISRDAAAQDEEVAK
jgi:ABC-type multidrug transport system fused ATPase/permease subunit